MEKPQGTWVIILTFLLAFVFAILPLPSWASIWRPEWIMMVLVYWCIALPERVSIGIGWLVGLLHDVVNDTLLGQHALSLSIAAFLAVHFHRQIRMFPLWQQAIFIFFVVTFSQLPVIWLRGMLGHPILSWTVFYPAVSSMILWTWLFIILRDLRRFYQVS